MPAACYAADGKRCISPLPLSCTAPKSGERKGAAKEAPKQEAPKGLFNFGGKHDCLNSTLLFVTSCDQDLTNKNPLNEHKMQRQQLTCHMLKPANMQGYVSCNGKPECKCPLQDPRQRRHQRQRLPRQAHQACPSRPACPTWRTFPSLLPPTPALCLSRSRWVESNTSGLRTG